MAEKMVVATPTRVGTQKIIEVTRIAPSTPPNSCHLGTEKACSICPLPKNRVIKVKSSVPMKNDRMHPQDFLLF